MLNKPKQEPRQKRFLNRLADLNFFIMTGKYIPNVSSGFRCYSKEAIEKILPKLKGNTGYGVELETLKIAVDKNLKIGHVPINVDYSKGKKPNFWKLFRGYLEFDINCLKEIWSLI